MTSNSSADVEFLPVPGDLADFLEGLSSASSLSPVVAQAIAGLREAIRVPAVGPALTVLVRTQGDRIESLQDSLLCLEAQTCRDFEVIVLLSNAAHAAAEQVRAIVAEQPRWFADRIDVVDVGNGRRAQPLNVGVERARGQYVAVFDDDDLLFGNWIECFVEAAVANPGRMIRACVATQEIEPEGWRGGRSGYRSNTWPAPQFVPFDFLDHFKSNRSPFMAWAFPRSLFSVLGVRFDESLDVCEDWDLIMRGSLLCGVYPVPELTAIYRQWRAGKNSFAIHSREVWKAAESDVVEKLDRRPILLPRGSASAMRDRLSATTDELTLQGVLDSKSWRLTAPLRGAADAAANARSRARNVGFLRRSVWRVREVRRRAIAVVRHSRSR